MLNRHIIIFQLNKSFLTKCFFVIVVFGWTIQKLIEAESEIFFGTLDFIKKYGYEGETHSTTTEDGYELQLHRIFPRTGVNRTYPVLLQHGFLASSEIWVLRGPPWDLAFMLADQGYDVWLGNVRGNHYSRKIDNNSTDNKNSFDFSYHEMGLYDLPALLDYVLSISKSSQAIYVSHSMGNTIHMVMGATKPEYNKKINHAIAIGPMFLRESFKVFSHQILEFFYNWSKSFLKYVDYFHILRNNTFKSYLMHLVCHSDRPWSVICSFLMTSVGGPSKCSIKKETFNIIPAHSPTGAIYHTLGHFYDNINSGQFRMRNFGLLENIRKYNSTFPPKYDVGKINTPISIYYGSSDIIATPECARLMKRFLPNVVAINRVENFNHMDLIWAEEATLLYKRIITDLNKKTVTDKYCPRKPVLPPT